MVLKEGLGWESFNDDNTVGNGNCSPSGSMVEEKINDGICINLRDWKMRKRSWIIVDE